MTMVEADPRANGAEKLTGTEDLYRVRVGDWRIVYAIRDRELVVIVVRIGHRGDACRPLAPSSLTTPHRIRRTLSTAFRSLPAAHCHVT